MTMATLSAATGARLSVSLNDVGTGYVRSHCYPARQVTAMPLTVATSCVQIVDAGEDCDDGNSDDGDGCTSACEHLVCGDGFVRGNEECDDGNTVSGDGCTATCQLEFCGDGIINNGETCDDQNNDNEDGCLSTCRDPQCGDGVRPGFAHALTPAFCSSTVDQT